MSATGNSTPATPNAPAPIDYAMELINSPEQVADAVLKETEDYASSLNELSINEDNRAISSSSEDNLLEMKNAKRVAYDLLERVRVELTRTYANPQASMEEINQGREVVQQAKYRYNGIVELYNECKKNRMHKPMLSHAGNSRSAVNKEHTAQDEWSSFNNSKISRSELPILHLSVDKKDSDPDDWKYFNTVEIFFKTFERIFRINQVNILVHWRDYMALSIGEANLDWYQETIESHSPSYSWEEAKDIIRKHFENPAKAIEMFGRLLSSKQRNNETVSDFTARFNRLAQTAQCSDSNMLARIYINSLHDDLNLHIRTVLSSNYGATFLQDINSIREVEKLASGLEVHKHQPYAASTPYKHSKGERHGFKGAKRGHSESSNGDFIKKQKNSNGHFTSSSSSDSSSSKKCLYCKDTWFKGHKCMEFFAQKNKSTVRKIEKRKQNVKKLDHPSTKAWNEFAKRQSNNKKSSTDDELEDKMQLGKCIRAIKQEKNDLLTHNSFSLYTPIIIQTNRALGLIDTGAEISVINRKFIEINKVKFYHKTGLINLAGKDNVVKRIGITEPLELKYNGKTFHHSFEIMDFNEDDKCNVILGLDILSHLGIALTGVAHNWDDNEVIFDDSIDDTVKPNNSPAGTELERSQFIEKIHPLLAENMNIPKDAFCTVPESIIHLPTEKGKIVNHKQYPIAYKLKPVLDEAINKWLDNGTITKAPVNTAWNSPLTLADKKDANGNKTGKRPCLDPRHINALLPDDKFPIPLITDIFHELSGSSIFTTLDLTAAFHRFKIHDEDQPKTAFTYNGQQYMFVGAPFGIKFLSNVFQRVMTQIFKDMPFVRTFIDDIVIMSKNMEEHAVHVKAAIEALTKVNLVLNVDKCHFAQSCVYLLGFCISAKGSSLDTRKLTNIEEWPRPTCGTDVQRFLGVVNYFREHIPKAAMLTAPLDHLRNSKIITEKDWTPLHQTHFEAIKKVLLSNVVLSQPDLRQPFFVATDASNYGIGAVLYQEHVELTSNVNSTDVVKNDNVLKDKGKKKTTIKYIGFMARSLSKSERNYSTTKRELLAIVFALKKFHKFLWGNPFTLYTDHKALTYLHTQKYANTMMMNWFDTILDYQFKVIHLPGMDNILPDHLSRLFPTDQMLRGSEQDTRTRNGIIHTAIRAIRSNKHKKFTVKKPAQYKQCDYMTPPENERKQLMLRAHLMGHFGAENIVKVLHNDGLHWKNMIVDAVELVKSCVACQKHNITRKGYHPLRPVYSYLPGDHWSMDLAELPTTPNDNKYLLVLLDICTRFCILRCLPNKKAKTIAGTLVQVFSDFGYPRILQSDNGTEFKNVTMKLLTESTGIDHRLISPYHPQANGSAERWVKTAKIAIAKSVQGTGQDWDFYVPSVQLFINNKVSKRLNTPPFSLMFARKMNGFEDYRKKDPKKAVPLSYEELLERIDHMNQVVFPAIKDKTDKYVENMKKQFEKHNTIVDDFKEGSHVMAKVPTMTGSLNPVYDGPYTVIRKTRGGSYVLQDEMGLLMSRDYTPSELKPIDLHNINEDNEEVYEIEGIVDHRGRGNNREFKVRWKGYSKDEDSWLTPDKITHTSTIENYMKRMGLHPQNKFKKDSVKNKPLIHKHNNEKGILHKATESLKSLYDKDTKVNQDNKYKLSKDINKTHNKHKRKAIDINDLRRSKRNRT